MSAALLVHRGARIVEREELETLPTPASTVTHYPLPHHLVLDRVATTLQDAGFIPSKTQLSVSADNARFFATMDLTSRVSDEVGLCVGVRNSHDRSFPIAMCIGERVFVCDNLAFRSDIIVSKKHTRFGESRFNDRLSQIVLELPAFQREAAQRIDRLRSRELPDVLADALLLRAWEQGIVTSPLLPKVIHEYRHPRYPQFEPRNAWSLLNAFTETLKARLNRPALHAALTIKLQGFLDTESHYALAS